MKSDQEKSKSELIDELNHLRQRVAEMEEGFGALKAERDLLRMIIDLVPDYIYAKDKDGCFILNNQAHARALGAASVAEMAGKTAFDYSPAELAEQFRADDRAVTNANKPLVNKLEPGRDPDGEHVWLLTTKLPILDEWGQVSGVVGVTRNITERKREEDQIRQNEYFLRALNEITEAALKTPNIQTMFETLANRLGEVVNADGCYIDLWEATTETTIPVAAYAQMNEAYLPIQYDPGAPTITKAVVDAGHSIVIENVLDSGHLSAEDAERFNVTSVLGVPLIANENKLGAALLTFGDAHHFTEQEIAFGEQAARQVALAIARAQVLETERKMHRQTEALYHATHSLLEHQALSDLLQYMVDSIAEMFDIEQVLLITLDLDQECVNHFVIGGSPQQEEPIPYDELMEGLTGWVVRNLEPALSPKTAPDPRESPRVKERRNRNNCGDLIVVPLHYRGKILGTITAVNAPENRSFSEQDVELLVTIAAQTAVAMENIKLLEGIRASEQKLERILDTMIDGVIVVDAAGRVTYSNNAAADILEVDRDAFLDNHTIGSDWERIGEDGLPYPKEKLPLSIALAEAREVEPVVFGIKRNEVIKWLSVSAVPLFDKQHRLSGAVTSFQDLTERRQADEVLLQRNRELRLINQVSQAIISTLDLDAVLTTVLEEVRLALEVVACSAWLIEKETDELVCRQVTDPQSKIVRGWRVPVGTGFVGLAAQTGESILSGNAAEDTRHYKRVDLMTGLTLNSILSVPLRVKGNTIGVLQAVDAKFDRFSEADLGLLESLAATAAIAIENVRLYEQARQDASTKSMLLNEVNHRVKNNLAAIIGLLYAERRHMTDDEEFDYQAFMTDMISRIGGLETVHNMLSASEWSPLQLSELADRIVRSALQALPSTKHLSVSVPMSSIYISPKQANSLAIVINELTTNTMKYALTGRAQGQITVEMSLEHDTICVKFCDDGPGYAEDVLSGKKHSVGLYLINNIVHNELRGRVKLSNQNGAVTCIYFKSHKKSGER
ncbi:MAG: GAF domain-containing protein [Anaerolineae bacterium]|nr:GAF domain-containing protein [Anaerolineae bacterium]